MKVNRKVGEYNLYISRLAVSGFLQLTLNRPGGFSYITSKIVQLVK